MNEITDYLSIAGIAHRRALALREEVAADRQSFPSGEQVTAATEIACCEAIICIIQATLAAQHHVLEFSDKGKARARIPFPLQKDGEEPPELETSEVRHLSSPL